MYQLLVQNGASLNDSIKEDARVSPLAYSFTEIGDLELTRDLIKRGCKLNTDEVSSLANLYVDFACIDATNMLYLHEYCDKRIKARRMVKDLNKRGLHIYAANIFNYDKAKDEASATKEFSRELSPTNSRMSVPESKVEDVSIEETLDDEFFDVYNSSSYGMFVCIVDFVLRLLAFFFVCLTRSFLLFFFCLIFLRSQQFVFLLFEIGAEDDDSSKLEMLFNVLTVCGLHRLSVIDDNRDNPIHLYANNPVTPNMDGIDNWTYSVQIEQQCKVIKLLKFECREWFVFCSIFYCVRFIHFVFVLLFLGCFNPIITMRFQFRLQYITNKLI